MATPVGSDSPRRNGAAPASRAVTRPRSAGVPAGGRGRVSLDDPRAGILPYPTVIAPASAEREWSLERLDTRKLDRMSPHRLMELLADLSPEVSAGLWQFLRFANAGYELKAVVPTPADPRAEEDDAAGQAWLDGFVNRLEDNYGSLDIIFTRLHLGGFLRGAYVAELVLDANGRDSIDLATPDPASFRFRTARDEQRGDVYQLGQLQAAQFVPMPPETVQYLPIDPFPGNPYGRPIAAPVLFAAVFLLVMLHDLRRVVQQQGWPRYDLTVNLDVVKTNMPADILADPEKVQEWIDDLLAEVSTAYSQLDAADAFAHTSDVTVGRPTGAVDSSALGQIGSLIEALERMLARALKTMPIMLGLTEGVSEANANRQYEAWVAGVKALQHLCENLVGRLCTEGARAAGVQTRIVLRFAEPRASERQRDAMTEALEIANAVAKRDQGWITQDDACQDITGHDAVAEPTTSSAPSDAPDTGNPDANPPATPALPPGFAPQGQSRGLRLPAVPEKVTYSNADQRRLRRQWDAAFADSPYVGMLDATVVGDG